MAKKKNWTLCLGCHRGTVMTRDEKTFTHGSLRACKRHLVQAKKSLSGLGYQLYFAIAISPRGKRITLEEGSRPV